MKAKITKKNLYVRADLLPPNIESVSISQQGNTLLIRPDGYIVTSATQGGYVAIYCAPEIQAMDKPAAFATGHKVVEDGLILEFASLD